MPHLIETVAVRRCHDVCRQGIHKDKDHLTALLQGLVNQPGHAEVTPVGVVEKPPLSVDTPADLERVRRRIEPQENGKQLIPILLREKRSNL